MDIENRLEEAKKLMEWSVYNSEPTTLEYLRYYKSGIIGEVHIEAQIEKTILEAQAQILRGFRRRDFVSGDFYEHAIKDRLPKLLEDSK